MTGKLETWLVAHDFSASALLAADVAAADAARAGADLLLLHSLAPIHQTVGMELVGATDALFRWDALMEEALAATGRELDAECARLRAAHPGVRVNQRIWDAVPASGIISAANELGVSRIYVGSHGRKGLQRFFLGSVAERVLRLAEVPVVVVKAPHAD